MSTATMNRTDAPGGVARRGAWMAVGRVTDQAALGIAGLIMAARLSVDGFAPAGALLVAYSVAATLADLGLAHEMLRLDGGDRGDRRLLRTVRAVNGSILIVAIALWALGHPVAALATALWFANGEAMLRQSAAMLSDRHRRFGLAQCAAALWFIVVVVFFGETAVALGLALLARTLVELLLLPSADDWFTSDTTNARPLNPLPVAIAHSIGFGTRNVDFLIGAPTLGGAGFARYVFAYRLANAGFAPVGTIATRLGIAELANEPEALESRYNRGLRVLLGAGLAAAIVTIAASPLVPIVVGEEWRSSVHLIVVLAIALPWRFIDGLVSPLLYVSGNHGRAVKLEVVRLAAITVAVLAGASFGVEGLAVAMATATTATVWAAHAWASRRAGVPTGPWLGVLAVLTIAAILIAHVVLP